MIELLIVITIIGILVSIGLPSYKNYIERARFSEVTVATAAYKIAISLGIQEGTPIDDLNSGENGVPKSPKPTKNLKSIQVEHGVITSIATKTAGGYTYILTPNEDGVNWHISGSCVDANVCKS